MKVRTCLLCLSVAVMISVAYGINAGDRLKEIAELKREGESFVEKIKKFIDNGKENPSRKRRAASLNGQSNDGTISKLRGKRLSVDDLGDLQIVDVSELLDTLQDTELSEISEIMEPVFDAFGDLFASCETIDDLSTNESSSSSSESSANNSGSGPKKGKGKGKGKGKKRK